MEGVRGKRRKGTRWKGVDVERDGKRRYEMEGVRGRRECTRGKDMEGTRWKGIDFEREETRRHQRERDGENVSRKRRGC